MKRSSGTQDSATVTSKEKDRLPVDDDPQSGYPEVFINLKPGPNSNPLGNVFSKSQIQ